MKISFKWVLFAAFAVLFAWSISGCKSYEKAVTKYKASKDFPRDCASAFPPKIIIGRTDTLIIEGVTIDCDSVTAAYEAYWASRVKHDTVVVKEKEPSKIVPCPPSREIVRVDTFINTAELEAAKRHNNDIQDLLIKMTKERDEWKAKFEKSDADRRQYKSFMWWIIVIGALFIGGFIWAKTRK